MSAPEVGTVIEVPSTRTELRRIEEVVVGYVEQNARGAWTARSTRGQGRGRTGFATRAQALAWLRKEVDA